MKRLVFLLEERSMKAFLEEYLPRRFPGLSTQFIPHEGKKDLERSIPRKLRSWHEPGVRFVIVRDNDGADCTRIKAQLKDLCVRGGRPDALVRIVCQHLEAWYLGAPAALADAFADPGLNRIGRKAKYADPDRLTNASQEIYRLIPEFQKTSGARRIGKVMPVDEAQNNSRSFTVFVRGVAALLSAEPA